MTTEQNSNNPEYLVTTRLEVLQKWIEKGYQIFMVDGTVPGWEPRIHIDYHFNHHEQGGADIQIDEMPKLESLYTFLIRQQSSALNLTITGGMVYRQLIVTTQLDADACVAAAWLQLCKADLFGDEIGIAAAHQRKDDVISQLRAIAYDCDHLAVPPKLSQYADFSAKCVAAMKENSKPLVAVLGLPKDRKTWTTEQKEEFNSRAFKDGTERLIAACKGLEPFPGEISEADAYFDQLECDTQMLLDENRVTFYRDCLLIDFKDLGKRLDPRCAIKAYNWLSENYGHECKTPITLTRQEVFENGKFNGFQYILGIIPLHPALDGLDYTQGVFEALTKAELEKNIRHYDASINDTLKKELVKDYFLVEDYLDNLTDLLTRHKLGWGGRKTVGGSSWNTPSGLTPEEVIDTVLVELGFDF